MSVAVSSRVGGGRAWEGGGCLSGQLHDRGGIEEGGGGIRFSSYPKPKRRWFGDTGSAVAPHFGSE